MNIDDPILDGLKDIQEQEGKSLSRVVSDLLLVALNERKATPPAPFEWISQGMGVRVDVVDRDAIYDLMDADGDR